MTRIFDIAATTVLSPVLAAQALWVVARATRLPEAAGERNGITGTGRDLRLLIIGDSSAAGVGVAHQSQALSGRLVEALADRHRVNWTLIAKTGATTRNGLAWLSDHDGGPYDAAVVAFGVNDTKNGMPVTRWRRNISDLAVALQDRFGAGFVCFSGLPPFGHFPLLPQPLRWTLGRRAARFDAALRDVVDAHPHCAVISPTLSLDPALMAPDGFHPGPDVYRAWGEAVADALHTYRATGAPPAVG